VDPDRVAEAFAAAPRFWFLPERERGQAAHDGPISIGHGQTNSQPRTVEAMLRLLAIQRGNRILDVGSGSGWSTALLAELTGPEGEVLGLELDPDLVEFGRRNLARGDWPWAHIEAATPGTLGAPAGAPYDRILVSAEARAMPTELVDQLGADALMVIPVAGEMVLVERAAASTHVSPHGYYRFVPLR
jgi:protein-L-isoaspartate(D-aspartate) O-methyltransferase